MKWTVLLALLVVGCKSNSQTSYEDELWECWVENAANQGFDLNADFKKFEGYLVLGGLLDGITGQDYYNLFKKWHDNGDIDPTLSDQALDSLRKLSKHKVNHESSCHQQFLPKIVAQGGSDGKISQMNAAIEEILNSGDVGPSGILKPLLANFSPSDLDKSFCKVYCLLYIQSFISVDIGIKRRLPPIPTQSYNKFSQTDIENVFDIKVNANDQILADFNLANVEDLPDMVKAFISGDSAYGTPAKTETIEIDGIGSYERSMAVVSLLNDAGTSYDMYIKVQEAVMAAFEEHRNEVSLQFFKKPLDDLTQKELDAVKQAVPKRFIEATRGR